LGRRSARREEGALVVEGELLAAEALAGGCAIEALFLASGASAPTGPLGAVPSFELAPGVLERVASTQSPQPLLAVVRYASADRALLARAGFVVVAAGLSEPGNLGTMLRVAEAAGADAVVVAPDTVDVSNPKVVRASAGALFHVPVVDQVELGELRAAGLRVIGTSPRQGASYTDVDLTGRLAVVVGSEAHGLPDDAPVDEWVTVPHVGRSESLNAAMAAAVICFEAARQRGGGSLRPG